IAVVGIAGASGAAYWYQNKPNSPSGTVPQAASGVPSQGGAPGASGAIGGGAGGPPRIAGVEVTKVDVMKLTDDAQTVGNLRSRQGVVVRPEISGRIRELNFKDGERVKKGQLLVQLDDQLQQAQLKQALAELGIAKANHTRNQELLAQNFISKRTVDESAANMEVSEAKLSLAVATAARLKIVAPFDGITGIRTANPGDYLKDGADIVNVEDIEAMFVDFKLPERFQTKVRKGQTANIELDALPGRKFSAIVQAIDPLLDANGRSVSVRGCIDNRTLQLRPGMFARVTQVFGERDKALVVPEEAIVPQGPRTFVLKVVDGDTKDDKGNVQKISQRVEVKIGIRRPGRVEILEGVKEGETIVTAGQQRIQKDGSPVRVLPGASERPGAGGPPSAGGPPASVSGPAPSAVAATPTARPPAGRPTVKPPEGPNPCLAEGSTNNAPDGARSGGGRPATGGRPPAKS
ncbi:MAG: Multidrug resistance protein MdtA precursor, partial [Pseudomonadota bacterium]